MADKETKPKSRMPMVSAPTSKVTIAFPFSQIKTQEPSAELRELSAIVAALADQVAKLAPSPETDALMGHAQSLVTKLDR